jgi:hypothetical protein
MRTGRTSLALGAVFVVVLLMVQSGAAQPIPSDGSQGPGPAALSNLDVNLTVNPNGSALSPFFWGTTISPREPLLPNEADIINSTPTQVILWPGATTAEEFNPINNTIYPSGPGGTKINATTSEAEFVAFCKNISCTAIMQVPAEIDNWRIAEAIVNYTEVKLNFTPYAWEIGNEPELWRNWGRSWGNWTATGAGRTWKLVSPDQYAVEEQTYIQHMLQADPTIRFIGLPGTGRAENHLTLNDWVQNVTFVDGGNLTAIAFHDYPAPISYNQNKIDLSSFYSFIYGPVGLPARYGQVTSWVEQNETPQLSSSCANASARGGCDIQVWVTEVGSGLSHGAFGNYSDGFAGGLGVAV